MISAKRQKLKISVLCWCFLFFIYETVKKMLTGDTGEERECDMQQKSPAGLSSGCLALY